MTLVDANVLMYAVGKAHAHKARSGAFLEGVAEGRIEAVLDAETLQEILHRYRAVGREADAYQVYRLARKLFPEVLPITGHVMDRAAELIQKSPHVASRDAVHAAVVFEHRLTSITSFDKDFDRIPGLRRVEP